MWSTRLPPPPPPPPSLHSSHKLDKLFALREDALQARLIRRADDLLITTEELDTIITKLTQQITDEIKRLHKDLSNG